MASIRESSRQNWTSSETIQDINSGLLQRITDATELMAKNHLKLHRIVIFMRKKEINTENYFMQNSVKIQHCVVL